MGLACAPSQLIAAIAAKPMVRNKIPRGWLNKRSVAETSTPLVSSVIHPGRPIAKHVIDDGSGLGVLLVSKERAA
jgi:hypothetical protein